MNKTYCKTASLFRNGILSSAILSPNNSKENINIADTFGKHIGMAFQVKKCLKTSVKIIF